MRLEQSIDRLLDKLLSPFAIIAGVMLALLSILVTTDVLVRWFTGRPIIGVFEVAESMLVYCAFFALAYVQFKNQQLSVDILSTRAKGRLGGALRVLDALASLLVYGAITLFTAREWLKAHQGGFLRRGMFEIPTTALLSAIVVGAALVCLVLVWQFLKGFRQVATGVDERRPHGIPEISV